MNDIKVKLEDIDVDDEYREKSEIEHILDRPGTWIGSVTTEQIQYPLYVPSQNNIQSLITTHNPGLIKLIDEVISNSVDAHRSDDVLYNITKINVTVNQDGYVCVEDNGGIPVKKLKTGYLVPHSIFGRLRTSGNYNDDRKRKGAGTNGLGVKIANIFSKQFSVETSDGVNSVKIDWSDNMQKALSISEVDKRITPNKNHYTKVSFNIDLQRFGMETMVIGLIRIIQMRCIVASALNPKLEVNFNSDINDGILNSCWYFDSFNEFVNLFLKLEERTSIVEFKQLSKGNHIVIVPDYDFVLGFVNGAICSDGTHISRIQNQITKRILAYCEKHDMELITEKDITSRFAIFANCTIINPEYTSQAKEKLSSRISTAQLKFDEKFFKEIEKSQLIQSLKDFYSAKYLEAKKKETKKLNGKLKLTKSKKLVKPKIHSTDAELWLFEGNSASNGFRKARNTNQAAYLLRGKIKNTFNLERSQIFENEELREVIAAQGLLFDNPKHNLKNLKFDKIVLATDMDHDGNHICGLFLAFYGKHFPELIKAGKIYRALSPIVIAEKGKDKQYFYDLQSYENVEHNLSKQKYEITYTKGLGGLSDDDYYQLLRNQKLIQFTIEDLEDIECIKTWFDKSTVQRKELLIEG